MEKLGTLIKRIVERVNINLREPLFDVGPYVSAVGDMEQMGKFYAFYGITTGHPLHFRFSHSSLAGSFFLGKCLVDNSVLYKSDIRGDELKSKGDIYPYQDFRIPVHDDEVIHIKDSFLVKTLVHNFSHDPENLEEFLIQNTAALNYANIHGAPVEGCFLGPFSTVDLTTLHDCVIGAFAYLQTGELSHELISEGRIWVHGGNTYQFNYQFDPSILRKYIRIEPGTPPEGVFIDFVEARKDSFQPVYDAAYYRPPIEAPAGSSLSPYAVVRGQTRIGENVLVAQRAYLENAWLGNGANAQENCYIIDSNLEGNNITAHGGKIVHAKMGRKVFVGFNSFLHGSKDCPLSVGAETIIMPHSIIDLEEPLEIPSGYLVWGLIRNQEDLKNNAVSLEEFSEINGNFSLGSMEFSGDGKAFVSDFKHRIEHILEANGAYFDGKRHRGHAQNDSDMAFNTIQPYPEGDLKGIYPTIEILP